MLSVVLKAMDELVGENASDLGGETGRWLGVDVVEAEVNLLVVVVKVGLRGCSGGVSQDS